MALKVKPKSFKVLGGLVIALALMYGITGAGFMNLAGYVFPAIGFFLGLFLLSEIAWNQYLNASAYRSLTANDAINILGAVAGGMVIVGSVLAIPLVSTAVPATVLAFFGSIGAILAAVVAIIALMMMFT